MSAELLYLTLEVSGPLFLLSMQLSYILDANRKLSSETPAGSVVPSLCLLLNSFVWATYAHSKGNHLTMLLPNLSGVVAGSYCIAAHHMRADILPTVEYSITAASIILILILFAWGMLSSIGLFGACLTVLLMGAPLFDLATVISTKSSDVMSFSTTVFTFLNTLSWTLYGWLDVKDAMVIVPNLIGLILACIQLAVFAIYSRKETQYTTLLDEFEVL
jgi:solute carrier family 50 (sugar transporter)